MNSGTFKRSRWSRVAPLNLPPNRWAQGWRRLRRPEVMLRLGLCLAAALFLWGVTGGWGQPFSLRVGFTPPRDLVTRVTFAEENEIATEAARREARSDVVRTYAHDVQPVVELQQALKNTLFHLAGVESFEQVDSGRWREFLPRRGETGEMVEEEERAAFDELRALLRDDPKLERIEQILNAALRDPLTHGLIDKLDHDSTRGGQTQIVVHPAGDEERSRTVEVERVLIGRFEPKLKQSLVDQFRAWPLDAEGAERAAERFYTWLRPKLPRTLTLNIEATNRSADLAAARVEPVLNRYEKEKGSILARGGLPLTVKEVRLLRLEHEALRAERTWTQALLHSIAHGGMYLAMYLLCGVYLAFHRPQVLLQLRRFSMLLGLVVTTVTLAYLVSPDPWRSAMTPLLLFGMTAALAYDREMALLLSACVTLVVVLTTGQGLAEFVIYLSSLFTGVMLLRRVRSRSKLIYVGLVTSIVAMATTFGVYTMVGQPLNQALLHSVAWYGLCCLAGGVLMTGLLPFLERLFDVQTELSLLELGDVAHPLLRELVRRAPGTYNHSINVAALAEAAADSIGANGLLVRVGAYFHDIGKMLKPGYFVENQGQQGSRHDSLPPAMSTLVIIAHVKDGADLARQHNLPQPIIDFIEQHHGTTLVKYFFDQAARRQAAEPEGSSSRVEESNFRYPGPKPQTREAAVMMLADAVESACRTLTDPAPARIESLVHELAMQRLLDHQFDDCRLTLDELHRIEHSLVKSLTAMYHSRVKYPDQQTA